MLVTVDSDLSSDWARQGGGAIITLCMVIISDVVSLKQRGKFQGITGTVVVLSNSIGPLIGPCELLITGLLFPY